jgi:hypothetical protein
MSRTKDVELYLSLLAPITHPKVGPKVKFHFKPRKKNLRFEVRRRSFTHVTFSIPPSSPSFQEIYDEAMRAAREVLYTSTHAVAISLHNPEEGA